MASAATPMVLLRRPASWWRRNMGPSTSPKDLLLAAVANQTVPRPAWLPFVGVHAAYLLGVSAQEYFRSAELIARGLQLAAERYSPDGLPVVFDLQMEAEVLGCEMHWADDTPPSVASHPLLEGGIDDLPAFETGRGRYPTVAEAMKRIRPQLGSRIALYGLITGPFTLALHLAGTNVFLDMYKDPESVKRLMGFCSGICEHAATFYLEHGADVIAVVDPMTSQISPAHFDEFVAGHVNRVFDRVRGENRHSSLFVCGTAARNLENMCRTHCDNVCVDENISLEALRDLSRRYRKSFGGNLKLTSVLLSGTVADAEQDARRCLEAGGSRGFILAPGCDLPHATPPENIEAVSRVVHQWRSEIPVS